MLLEKSLDEHGSFEMFKKSWFILLKLNPQMMTEVAQ
jgi:hypothetical protein